MLSMVVLINHMLSHLKGVFVMKILIFASCLEKFVIYCYCTTYLLPGVTFANWCSAFDFFLMYITTFFTEKEGIHTTDMPNTSIYWFPLSNMSSWSSIIIKGDDSTSSNGVFTPYFSKVPTFVKAWFSQTPYLVFPAPICHNWWGWNGPTISHMMDWGPLKHRPHF